MYKLMIVEDEPLIRAGLKQYFNWHELGIESILEAENGKDGIEIALRERPDLVITDIRMPEINGLEMIERLRPALPDTLFLILTGYNDFTYAQKAIRLGNIQAYLLKPLQYEESLTTIVESIKALSAMQQANRQRSELESAAKENSMHRGGQIVKSMLDDDGSLQEDAVLRQFGLGGKIVTYHPIVLSCILPSTLDVQARNAWKIKAERLLHETVESMYPAGRGQLLAYFSKSKLYAITINDDQEIKVFDKQTEERINNGLIQTGTELQATFYMAVGKPAIELSQACISLQLTEKALNQRFFRQDRRLFRSEMTGQSSPSFKESFNPLDNKDRELILTCLEQGEVRQTRELLKRMSIQTVQHFSYDSYGRWLAFLQDIIGVTLRFAHRNDIRFEGVYSDKVLTLAFVDDFATAEQLFDWIADWMIHLHSVYRDKAKASAPQESQIFEQIETFIKQHIDKEVTLQAVADRFFYNPSYLSRLFKTKLNKNYMTFLTEIRIRYAQQCLMDQKAPVADVCTMCGYKSYKHFVKTFRSVTRMTPTEYRKQLGL